MLHLLERTLALAGLSLYQQYDPRHLACRSPQWRSLRDRFVKEHPVCCVSGLRTELECHHLHPYHLHPERELDWDNLRTVSRPYHLLVGHHGTWAYDNPDFDREAAEWRDKIERARRHVARGAG